MSALFLLDDLVEEIGAQMKEFKLKTKGGDLRSPRVFSQYLPMPKTPKVVPRGSNTKSQAEEDGEVYGPEDFEENFPCVIVQLGDAKDEAKISTVDIRILIGTYDESRDCQGFRDVVNIASHLRLFLLENVTFKRRYILQHPLRFGLFTDQPHPVYFGHFEMAYAVTGVVEAIKRLKGDWRDGKYPDQNNEGKPRL